MAKKLLLADDSVTIQKVVGISFASEDVTLITVDNGDDAISKARESRPDAILADVVMPGKSGYEVCEAINADPELRHIPVLLLTGTFEAFDEERAKRCGAAGHVAKPFEAQALVERVRQLFARPVAPPPPPAPIAAAPAAKPIAAARAAAPIAAAAAASAPEQAPASPSSESFDFFDDDLGDLAPPEPAEAAREEAEPIDSDDAFAFGEDEFEAPQPDQPVSSQPEPAATLDRTVAILPDEVGAELDLPAAVPTELDASLELAGPDTTADDLLPAELAGPEEPVLQPTDDFFDFDIGGSPAGAGRDAARPVRSEDLAEATVLDPKGASGYDVSSSDLGDPVSAELFGEELASEDSLAMPIFGEPLETGSRTPMPATELSAPAPVVEPKPAMRREPVAAPEPAWPPEPAGAPEPAWPPEPAGAPEPAWPPEPATPAFEVAADETPVEPEAPALELDESSLEDLMPPAPAVAPQPASSADSGEDQAAAVLEHITPRLREQLHDTLEKIAWESFGDVTEQIVRAALERVEQIAWEVIPQMAETMIREEIRRMKGESEG